LGTKWRVRPASRVLSSSTVSLTAKSVSLSALETHCSHHREEPGEMRIYVDTSALPNNIRHSDPKSQADLAAYNQLAERFQMLGSHLVHYEAERTKDETRRNSLLIDIEGLEPVRKDEKLLGFNSVQTDRYGFVTYPLISDVQDERLRQELMDRGLDQRDAEHITQAVCNDCDVLLTRDEKSIINLHRGGCDSQMM
jgi:hypothetical protein